MNTTDKSDQFLAVLQAHKGIVYKIAHSYCHHAEDRKDLVQQITVQLWKSFDYYNDQYRYSTWIYRIALNEAISFYRKEHRRKQVAYPFSEDLLQLVDPGVADDMTEQVGLLQQFIGELRALDKALLLLYLDEKSHREIADIMGISETNVATKIGRIKTALKQKFSALKS